MTDKPCPTCGNDGSEAHPFDANCLAAWAHVYLGVIWNSPQFRCTCTRIRHHAGCPKGPANV